MNVDVSTLTPGVFGLSHGGGVAGEIIRSATGSWAGHSFLYLGGGQMIEGVPPVAKIVPAGSYPDAIWAHRMWDQLATVEGWYPERLAKAQAAVVARGHALAGGKYDFGAYLGFELEVLHLRTGTQLAPEFAHDSYRVCSALVADAETFGGVPLNFTPEDGPGIIGRPGLARMPVNLVAPGMLLGLAQRSEWI